MNRLPAIIFTLLTLIIFTLTIGCNHNGEASKRMDSAEALMDSMPDSALCILSEIDQASLRNDGEKARHALLYTQALDKNYLDLSDDSLISLSVKYFSKKKDIPNLIRSYYYQGRVEYHKDIFTPAILSYFKAKELADDNGDPFWAGMACRGISDIFMQSYNAAEELAYARKEYCLIKKSGRQPYINYALHDLGRAFYNNNHQDSAIFISYQLADSAALYDDTYLHNAALQLRAYSLVNSDKFAEAIPLLREICCGEYAESTDSMNLCLSLAGTGRIDEATELMAMFHNGDPLMINAIKYKIARSVGNRDCAMEALESAIIPSDSVIRRKISHNLSSSLADYFDMRRRLDKAEIDSSRKGLYLTVMVSLFVVLAIATISILIRQRLNRMVSEKVLLAHQLQLELERSERKVSACSDTIQSLIDSKDRLIYELDKRECEISNSSKIIRLLLDTRYGLIEELCLIMMQNSDTKVARRKIADSVTRVIEGMSLNGEKISVLEKQSDEMYGNLMSDFKSDLPGLKEADYLLFLLLVHRLSIAVITLLLKETKVEAVYNRKRRLKDKIKALDQSKQDRYLPFLS